MRATKLLSAATPRGCLLAALAASTLALASPAEAAPSCPEQNVSTPYLTPVTITLACTDPLHPIAHYRVSTIQNGVALSVSGDQVTATPQAAISNRSTLFNYWATNAIGESGIGSVNLYVGPAPPIPPPSNDPPIARCDVYNAEPGELLRVDRQHGVLANDSDPDGDELIAEGPRWAFNDDGRPKPDLRRDGSFIFSAPAKPRVYSFRYEAVDARLARGESALTIGVGIKAKACHAAFDPPAPSPYKRSFSLRRTGGSVRIRGGDAWSILNGKLGLNRPLLIDARRGSVGVRLLSENNYDRQLISGRFSGGLFKLGQYGPKVPGHKRQVSFTSFELAGGLGCHGGSRPGRQLKVAATPSFFFKALRLKGYNHFIRNKPVLSRFTISDHCDGTSRVSVRAGRVHVTPFGDGALRILRAGQSLRAHPRSKNP